MNDEIHQLAGAYALDALDDVERAEFEAHLSTCQSCQDTVAEFQATAAELGLGSTVAPPLSMRDQLLAQLDEVEQVEPIEALDQSNVSRPEPQVGPIEPAEPAGAPAHAAPIDLTERRTEPAARPPVMLMAAAAVAAIALVGISVVALQSDGPQTEVAGSVDVAAAPDAHHSTLEPTPAASAEGNLDLASGELQVIWSPSGQQAHLLGNGLPDPEPGQVYELWFVLADESVAAAGLFNPSDGSIDTVLDLDDHSPVAWAITIEPETGSDQPTTDPVLFGTI